MSICVVEIGPMNQEVAGSWSSSVNIRILVADDSAPWRRFVSSLILPERPEWHIVCEVSDGLEAVKKAEELRPDLILMDIGLPKLSGIDAARRISKIVSNLKILFLSAFDSLEIVQEALNTGASGYVVKLEAASELIGAVEAVFQGKRFISSGLSRACLTDGRSAEKELRKQRPTGRRLS